MVDNRNGGQATGSGDGSAHSATCKNRSRCPWQFVRASLRMSSACLESSADSQNTFWEHDPCLFCPNVVVLTYCDQLETTHTRPILFLNQNTPFQSYHPSNPLHQDTDRYATCPAFAVHVSASQPLSPASPGVPLPPLSKFAANIPECDSVPSNI